IVSSKWCSAMVIAVLVLGAVWATVDRAVQGACVVLWYPRRRVDRHLGTITLGCRPLTTLTFYNRTVALCQRPFRMSSAEPAPHWCRSFTGLPGTPRRLTP